MGIENQSSAVLQLSCGDINCDLNMCFVNILQNSKINENKNHDCPQNHKCKWNNPSKKKRFRENIF